MLKPWTRYFLYLGTLPTDLAGWLVVIFVRYAWGTALSWRDGVLYTEMRSNSKPAQTWYANWGGTTTGHAIFLKEGQPIEVFKHELVHVEQAESAGLLGLVALLATVWFAWPVGLLLWILMPALTYVLAGCCALLRGESFYRGNQYEEAAYNHED